MAISVPVVRSVPSLFGLDMPARALRLLLAVGLGCACYQLAPPDFERITRLMMGWDGFVLSVLLLSWLTIFRARTIDIRRAAQGLRANRTWVILFAITFIGVTISLLAVVLLLRGMREMPTEERMEHVLVSVVAIVSTWCLLHTLFALHYAHSYFGQPAGRSGEEPPGGLRFAGAEPTSYWDFAYFAFVIGMTAQSGDVAITTLPMRRLVLFHSLMAFGFNTAILALSINILSGLL